MTPAEQLKRAQRQAKARSLEEPLALQLRGLGIAFEREFTLPGRQFRWDFAFPQAGLLVEVQGGVWTNGAHSTGAGITRDAEKAAHAVCLGWRVMPVTGDQIKSGAAARWIETALSVGTRTC